MMEDQKGTSFFRFEDLRVYDKSLEYYNWVTTQAKQADDFAKRTLFMPLMDAATKVSINIAEGSSYNKSQFAVYLKSAKSAVRECVVLTTMAQQNGFFTEEQYSVSRTLLIEMTKMVGAMIVSLQKPYSKRNNDNTAEPSYEQTDVQDNTSDFNIDFNY